MGVLQGNDIIMKRVCLSLILAVMATLLIAMPVLAVYYAYIYVEESDGNSYESLPISVSCNTTTLVQGDFMTSTALDTRVLTGSGEALPHMVADDKVMFVTDLGAYEKKTLIFYLGGTSLSSFPIIVGYDGSFETPDDPDLELGYVMELLISGYFDASAGSDKNILYKEDAFRVWISAANKLEVSALGVGGSEEWELTYSSFTSGEHTIYVVSDGMQAKLYVDNFVTPKDTQNLWENGSYLVTSAASATNIYMGGRQHYSFYASGRFWCFYLIDNTTIGWRSSTDGSTWVAEQTVTVVAGDAASTSFSVVYRDGYLHIVYGGYRTGSDYVRYRRGEPETDGTIIWSADWQTAFTLATGVPENGSIAVDDEGYPFITYTWDTGITSTWCIKSSANNGTWSMAVGYPFEIAAGEGTAIYSYYGETNDDMYILYSHRSSFWLYGRNYNGSAWASPESISDMTVTQFDTVSDSEGNLYFVWECYTGTHYGVYLRVRYSDETWSSVTKVAGAVGDSAYDPTISYNPTTGGIYIFYFRLFDAHVYGYVLIANTLVGPYTYSAFSGYPSAITSTSYSDHIGVVGYIGNFKIEHQYLTFSWDWNDNENDWNWMQNNVMPYADDIQIAVDGVLQLEYKPDSIIQGTTLPDEENGHDAAITWGANPAGVDTSMSALQFEQSYNETYYYQYLSPGSTDIIKPEPGAMAGDVDLERLHDNPLYPLVQALTIPGFLTERLVWLGLAWLIVIGAMFGVHLGFDTRKDTEKPQHFILTTITGLGLSILFYTMGIFPLWVIILMAFGLVGAVIWERQPVI